MRQRLAATLVGTAIWSVATAVGAVTYSGSFTSGASITNDYWLPPASGNYLIEYTFDRPIRFQLIYEIEKHYNIYDPKTGSYLGGNDNEWYGGLDIEDARRGATIFKMPAGYVQYNQAWGGIEYGYFTGRFAISAWGSPGQGVNYVVTIDRLGDVPEPSTWTLLIGGFGLAGTALRRRRKLA